MPVTDKSGMTNALTIDVEDYYMVSAFADVVKFEDWHRYESRVERNTRRIMDLLGAHEVQATYFVLGWVAERHPKLVKEIHAAGHEVACHGYNHRLVYDLTPHEFRQDVSKAKSILEDLTGSRVEGYRAASYSIVQKSIWALDVLIEGGFTFDSSIFPIHHDRYGYAELLEAAGVDTVPELAQRVPANLLDKMQSTNVERKMVRRLPCSPR